MQEREQLASEFPSRAMLQVVSPSYLLSSLSDTASSRTTVAASVMSGGLICDPNFYAVSSLQVFSVCCFQSDDDRSFSFPPAVLFCY